MDRLDGEFQAWAKNNAVTDPDEKRMAFITYLAGWNARGNPWAEVVLYLGVGLIIAYIITAVFTHVIP